MGRFRSFADEVSSALLLITLSLSMSSQVYHPGNNCSPASILSLQAGIAVVRNSFPVIRAGILYSSLSFGQASCVVLCCLGRHPVSFCFVRAGILCRSGRHPVSLYVLRAGILCRSMLSCRFSVFLQIFTVAL